jgi:hypothetical protein
MRCTLSVFMLILSASLLQAGEWEPVGTELLKADKIGYGGISSVVVDRHSGDVFVWLSDKGLYKSTDQAGSFKQITAAKGRTEWPGCMQTHPNGPIKSWVIALVYGGPILTSVDGMTFSSLDKKTTHLDWVAVDWTDPEHNFLMTLKHESGGVLLVSNDGGKSFQDVGKGFGPAIIFDNKTAVVAQSIPTETKKSQQVLVRTTDGGKTFEKVAAFSAKAMPVWYEKTPYWLVDGALITSKDQGKTWEPISQVKGGLFGPVFGKDDKQMFVTTSAGIIESKDGGKTWSAPIAAPKEFKGISGMTWLGYDPKNDILYLAKMGADLYRLKR